MFKTYYQLSTEPFRLSPDSRFCFPHPSYRKAIIYMRHAIQRGEGFIMITGSPGTGKTTVIQHLLRILKPGQIVVAKLVTSQLAADDLLRLVSYAFNLNPEGSDKAKLLFQLERFLRQQHRQGRRALLIVDEAQDMAENALEELRLLTNIQAGTQQLLQIFLVGQEKLRNVVIAPALEQLQQRMIAATHLSPLDATETRDYIKYRLHRVGWSGDPLFSNEAYTIIHRYSRGIPRQINQICNRLLLHGSIEKKHRLGLADVQIVVEELQHELLLPVNKDESETKLPSPAELSAETYEEEPARQRTSPEVVTKSRTTNETEQGAQSAGIPAVTKEKARRKPTSATAPDASNNAATIKPQRGPHQGINRSIPVQQTSTAPARSGKTAASPGVPTHSDPVTTHDSAGKTVTRKRNALAFASLILLAGSLLFLLYTIHPDLISDANNTLSSWVSTGTPSIHSTTNPRIPQPRAAESRQDISTGTVLRSTAAAVNPPATWKVEPAMQVEEPGTGTVKLSQETNQGDLLELESELSRKGLLVEQLEDNTLKVRLSSDGIFDIDSAQLKNSAGSSLEALADVLRNHNQMTLRIVGHTDSSGAYDYNLQLSELRAKAVADQLIRLGLPAAAIQSEGRGDLDTRHENLPSYKTSLKRRVEIYIK
jgi:general secretion pathway protein A